MLAIQGINVTQGSNDFLLVPTLVGGVPDLSVVNSDIWFTTDGSDPRSADTRAPSSTATSYTGAITLPNGGNLRARLLVNGTWSALSDAVFSTTPDADLNQDGNVDILDIDFLAAAIQGQQAEPDLNRDLIVDQRDMRILVKDLMGTNFGDANLDLVFDSADLVSVFQTGEYEDNVAGNSTWADGDWNGDGDFSTSDLVLAFQDAGFVRAARHHRVFDGANL